MCLEAYRRTCSLCPCHKCGRGGAVDDAAAGRSDVLELGAEGVEGADCVDGHDEVIILVCNALADGESVAAMHACDVRWLGRRGCGRSVWLCVGSSR